MLKLSLWLIPILLFVGFMPTPAGATACTTTAPGCTATGTYTCIQRVGFYYNTAGPCTVAITSTGSGHLIAVEIVNYFGTTCTTKLTAPTDNKGGGSSTYNSDTGVVNPNGAGNMCLSIWSAPNSASGITSVTINTTSSYTFGFIEEWGGVATTTPFDKTHNSFVYNGGGSPNWTSGLSGTLTGTTDLAIGLAAQYAATGYTNTPTNGFGDGALQDESTCGCGSYIENKTLAANTSLAATGTLSAGLANISGIIVTYQVGSAAPVVRHRGQVINQ